MRLRKLQICSHIFGQIILHRVISIKSKRVSRSALRVVDLDAYDPHHQPKVRSSSYRVLYSLVPYRGHRLIRITLRTSSEACAFTLLFNIEIHGAAWTPQPVPLRQSGTVKMSGVAIDICGPQTTYAKAMKLLLERVSNSMGPAGRE